MFFCQVGREAIELTVHFSGWPECPGVLRCLYTVLVDTLNMSYGQTEHFGFFLQVTIGKLHDPLLHFKETVTLE